MATMTVEKWIEEIKGMSVLDLSNLVKALEEEFGVSAAAAPVVVAGPGGGGGGGEAAAEEEQSEFDVVLTAAGASNIQVIKVVGARRPGPREAEDMSERRTGPSSGVPRDGPTSQGRARRGRSDAVGSNSALPGTRSNRVHKSESTPFCAAATRWRAGRTQRSSAPRRDSTGSISTRGPCDSRACAWW
jgi:large subunit ribosomal protein L7/L12